ncbi:subclass B3 metallo-beta-lactamase [Lysobacter capsici]|uniref:subclass B3 metallo-beta-lactamase n=1 Tax=Lysobacter capsici TaxID=435897 RepID=UPI001C0026C1|nr:subclass B3 metallo-beta-lactamase [Lysobacter capsici]QWF14866.1 subclass B3 metallo-beta-lactamase [Lysobacter capsici]
MRFRTGVLAASLISSLLAACASAPHADRTRTAKAAAPAPCPVDPSWDEPTAPRHIYANTWYVGTCAISAILITSDAGHILIDGVTDKAAPRIEANIRALGFEPEDVRYIVSSHEHLDHVGGIARLQRDTGASVVAREPAASALERGHSDRSDPQFLSVAKFAPVASVRRIGDGEILRLGPIALTAHATPGHTAGGTSWTWSSCEGATCRAMVYADSVTPFSDEVYRYSENAEMVAAFRKSLATIAALPCDILLTPHPSASQLLERLDPTSGIGLVDTHACRAYAATGSEKLDTRLSKERADRPGNVPSQKQPTPGP